MSARRIGTVLPLLIKCYYYTKVKWEMEDLNSILDQAQQCG